MKKILSVLLAVGLLIGCTLAPAPSTQSPAPATTPAQQTQTPAPATTPAQQTQTPIPATTPASTPAPPTPASTPATTPAPPTSPPIPAPQRPNCGVTPPLFYQGVGSPARYAVQGRLVAGMIPHHLLASDMIAGFFALAAEQPPYDGVVIVSPSHFPENCNSMVVTATTGWTTPLGSVEPHTPLIEALLADELLGAENNPAAVELDHGAAGLVPFLKYYLPEVPLAVCLVQGTLPRERLCRLQSILCAAQQEKNILVIASADCSHYLMPEEAAKHDLETMEAIEQGQIERIFQFGDSNVDSPQAVTTFLAAAAGQQATVTRLDHSGSNHKLPHALTSSIYREGITTYLVYAGVVD